MTECLSSGRDGATPRRHGVADDEKPHKRGGRFAGASSCPSRRERTTRPSASVVVFLFSNDRGRRRPPSVPSSLCDGSRTRRTSRVAPTVSHATSATAGRDPDQRANRADAASVCRDGCLSVGSRRAVARGSARIREFRLSRAAFVERRRPRTHVARLCLTPTPHDVFLDRRTTAVPHRRERRHTSNDSRSSTATRRLLCARRWQSR